MILPACKVSYCPFPPNSPPNPAARDLARRLEPPPPNSPPPATSSVRDLAGKLESPFPPLFQLFPELSQQGTLVAGENSLTPPPPIPSGRDLAIRLEPTSPSPGTFFPPRFITNGLLKWKLENKEMFYFYRAVLRGSEGRL